MDVANGLAEKYPLFFKTCLYLQGTSFFYRDIFIVNEQIPINYPLAEKICTDAFVLCQNNWHKYTKRLAKLIAINVEFLRLQALLEKTGKYFYSSFAEVKEQVFNSSRATETDGVYYLWGLYFSEIFWVTHHRLFNFFLKEFVARAPANGSCLDAPVGSGIFLSNFLAVNKDWRGVGVDLSDTAIDFAGQIFGVNKQLEQVRLVKDDLNKYADATRFERIICVEFLEHVEDPVKILKKIKSLLAPQGKVFLVTVAWAAGIDHIYLYKNVEEIKEHFQQSGFQLEQELIQNIFPKDKNNLNGSKVALSYGAILS